ncbi:hypothetical protein Q3G72_007645 [Acer saccharum]|nr:hypothetical protein Q3G72_007645 [Acer saccharum]
MINLIGVLLALQNMGFIANMGFGSIGIMGLVLLAIQAYAKNLHPSFCGKSSCVEGGIALIFYTSLSLLALGSGGVRRSLTSSTRRMPRKPRPWQAFSIVCCLV